MTHFKEIQFNGSSKYGDILLQQEYEMSCFNLEHANTSAYSQLYDLYEKVLAKSLELELTCLSKNSRPTAFAGFGHSDNEQMDTMLIDCLICRVLYVKVEMLQHNWAAFLADTEF